VCDVFDALLSPRPYKDARPLEDVIRELARLRGSHLDPALAEACLPLAAELHADCFGESEPAPPRGAAAAWSPMPTSGRARA
jgi:HD-GYP domain-containing protein (c-di-GMP phosphodiesterase class II)